MSLIPHTAITVKRTLKGTNIGGVKAEGVSSDFTITGSLQPPSSRDIQMLPEGSHYTTLYKIYSKNYVPQDSSHETDVFLIDGKELRTIVYKDWRNNIINHKSILVGA